MPHIDSTPKRYIGFDIHKHYFVAIGVDPQLNPFGPHQASITQLAEWARKNLTPQDIVVVEMTTNTYLFSTSSSHWSIRSQLCIHPMFPSSYALRSKRTAALTLAQLHASGCCRVSGSHRVEVRELRATGGSPQ